MLKTLLLIPPAYGYNFPPLGTPALCAYLKVNGFSSEQRDLNIGYRDFLLDSLEVPGLNPALKKELLPLALNQFFEDIPGSRYYSACLPRKKSYAFLPYLPYGDAGNSSFYFTENLLSSRHLFRYLDDADENTFLRYYLDSGIAKTVKDGAFGLLGISVTSPSQAIAALTLCRLLKKEAPRAHLCLGGQWVTLFRKELLRRRDLCSVFDSF
ncbi:MAG TPA: hypothetical protein PLL10_05005, partial [Elusimicrobiales bacterium]|nr:hypothetical protein [Elusimicrobiales bacterium]